MSTTKTKLEPFQFTKAYRKDFDGKFKKLNRLARMHHRLMVKMAKAAQKRQDNA